jgi:hypothetical protein
MTNGDISLSVSNGEREQLKIALKPFVQKIAISVGMLYE